MFPYRYISKPLVMLLLLVFFCYNTGFDIKKYKYIVSGMLCFLLGDIFLIDHLNTTFLLIGLFLFVVGKIFYSINFSPSTCIDTSRLIPFSLLIFVYISVLLLFIYDNLGQMFLPIMAYMFISFLMMQMIYVRKGSTNNKSYYSVLLGGILFVVSETMMALKMFYADIFMQDFIIMAFYGLSQYFIITGLLYEKETQF